jgi:choline-sulfatase
MIRRGDFKYNYYKSDTPELYDLKQDPKEMQNLATNPEHKPKLEEMKDRLFAWHRPD